MDWIQTHLIYLTIHGSRAYGMANEQSDLDIKGIVVPPKTVEYNLFHKFEQAENHPYIESLCDKLRNPLNPKIESTVYSLRKFVCLASEVNPNIIELLWTDPSDHIVMTPIIKTLMENREMFLSNKARFTFAGYACAQAKKIERHRKWIVMGELKQPVREDFGLPIEQSKGIGEVFAYIKAKVEEWNLNQFPIDDMLRNELKDIIWEILTNVSGREISVANWPAEYHMGVINKLKLDFNLKEEVVALINAEYAYLKAKATYESWKHWKLERNPARKILEEKYGYDCKHSSQLVRLMRMGYEIVTEGKVIVKRPDAKELLSIKNGAWTYEKVMEYKEYMEKKLNEEYIKQNKLLAEGKPTPLPHSINKEKINTLYHDLYSEYFEKDKNNPPDSNFGGYSTDLFCPL